MANLWEETNYALNCQNITWDEVLCVCGGDFRITKENFEEIARQTDYDNGYGAPEIAEDLVVMGVDWWMTRDEYDGSEWWEFHKMPNTPKDIAHVERLSVVGTNKIGWESLKELNERGKE